MPYREIKCREGTSHPLYPFVKPCPMENKFFYRRCGAPGSGQGNPEIRNGGIFAGASRRPAISGS